MGPGLLGAGRRTASRPTGPRPPGQPWRRHDALLAIDAWEHAYYLQYENRKGEFFDATWNVVSWTDIGRSAPVPAAESATPS